MDYLLDSNLRMVTQNGDFVTGDNLVQQEALLLATNPGEWKENPLVGCGITNYLNSENPEAMKTEIKRQFKADGLTVNKITYQQGVLSIDANRS